MNKVKSTIVLTLVLLANALLLGHFYNRFFWPPDEGQYAYVAERLLEGAVLNKDVQEIHPGPIHFIHALCFKAFGRDFVSLRFPLIALSLLQTALLFSLFSAQGLWVAGLAAMSSMTFGFIQYLNPTPNWYCLFLTVALVYFFIKFPKEGRLRYEIIGFFLMVAFLFRQISGVAAALGSLTYLLIEKRGEEQEALSGHFPLAKVLLAFMGIGLLHYLAKVLDIKGMLFLGIWPFLALWTAFRHLQISNKEVTGMLGRMTGGAIVALAPTLLYHLAHGSLAFWIQDNFVVAVSVSGWEYLKINSFLDTMGEAARMLIRARHVDEIVNGLYWMIVPLLPAVTGFLTLVNLRKWPADRTPLALPVVAVFYSIVTLFNQIPIYLYFSLTLSIAGLLWLATTFPRPIKLGIQWMILCVSLAAVYYHAGQPLDRDFVRGERISLTKAVGLNKTSLYIDPLHQRRYASCLKMIKQMTASRDFIWAIPSNPELYFMTGRRNPFRFWNARMGIQRDQDVGSVIAFLRDHPVKLITFMPRNKNNSYFTEKVVDYIRAHYTLVDEANGFQYFIRPHL